MLPVRCQDASLCRLFFPFFFSLFHDTIFVGGTLCCWRKERGAARQIDLPESSLERSRSSSRHDLASRCLSFRSFSLSLVDSDRSWAGGTLAENIANRPDWIILWPGLEATGHKGTAAKRKYRGRVGSSQEFLPPSVHKHRQDLERIFWKIIWKILIN